MFNYFLTPFKIKKAYHYGRLDSQIEKLFGGKWLRFLNAKAFHLLMGKVFD